MFVFDIINGGGIWSAALKEKDQTLVWVYGEAIYTFTPVRWQDLQLRRDCPLCFAPALPPNVSILHVCIDFCVGN